MPDGSASWTGAGLGLQNRWRSAEAAARWVRFPCTSASWPIPPRRRCCPVRRSRPPGVAYRRVAEALHVAGREAGVLRDAREHPRPNLLVVVKGEDVVRPTGATQ